MSKKEKTIIDVTPNNPLQTLNTRLNNALSIDPNSYFEKIESNGTEIDVTKKTYNFINPIGKRSSMTIYDTNIIESMEKISHALHGKAILTYAICKEFSKINESGKLENMGFKTISEFGKAVYGLETSTVNHYARIGSTFINDDYTVKSGLPELSVSHFIELSGTVKDNDITPIIELYANGTLVDGMSTKKMRETLKSLNGTALPNPDKKEEQKGNVTTTEINSEATIIDSELPAEFDTQVVVGKILNACNVIESLFQMLSSNEIAVVGYQDSIDTLKSIAKTLL